MATYEMVIGLEVHVELATRTKIFCGCTTKFGGAPNTHTCPVCTGMPGTLPVANKKVVEFAVAAGLLLHLPAVLDEFHLTAVLARNRPRNRLETVDVLHLGARAEFLLADRAHGEVHIRAQ